MTKSNPRGKRFVLVYGSRGIRFITVGKAADIEGSKAGSAGCCLATFQLQKGRREKGCGDGKGEGWRGEREKESERAQELEQTYKRCIKAAPSASEILPPARLHWGPNVQSHKPKLPQ